MIEVVVGVFVGLFIGCLGDECVLLFEDFFGWVLSEIKVVKCFIIVVGYGVCGVMNEII